MYRLIKCECGGNKVEIIEDNNEISTFYINLDKRCDCDNSNIEENK